MTAKETVSVEERAYNLAREWRFDGDDELQELAKRIASALRAERAKTIEECADVARVRAAKWHYSPLSSISKEANIWAHDEAVVICNNILKLKEHSP